jgi:hypothetical protein
MSRCRKIAKKCRAEYPLFLYVTQNKFKVSHTCESRQLQL